MRACFVAMLLMMMAPAVAQGQTITVVNHAGLTQQQVGRFERSAVAQAVLLKAAWRTPVVRFRPSGWRIVLQSSYTFHHGWHGVLRKQPVAYVQVFKKIPWTVIGSHELMEMLEDPYGGNPEVCDPDKGERYWIDGRLMARFVGPAYFGIILPPI